MSVNFSLRKNLISIIIPVYNEEDNIDLLCKNLSDFMEKTDGSIEVILVNDGSTDQTLVSLKNVSNRDQRFKIIDFRRNYGQTAAMMAGMDFAKGDIIVPMDGDLQNDPEDISILIKKLDEGYDVVSGWRKNRQDNSLMRILPSRIANKLISVISGVHLHDYGCTLKAYRRDVIQDVKLYGEMHRFIPIYASWQGGKVTELPVRHHPRIHGQSKYGMGRVFRVILDLCVVKFLDRYLTKPIYVFGVFGLLSLLCSVLSGLLAVYLRLFVGISFILTPLPLLTVMTFIAGVIGILMGLLAEILVRTYFESQQKSVYLVKEVVNIDEND
jgi:dolichol-phosphate mannosyltransferase